MKNLYFLALLMLPVLVNAQMKTWENFSDSEVDHPFKYNYVSQPENNIDSKGNKWVLNANSIWKINGTDTTKFTNFPLVNGKNTRLSVVNEQVTFIHYSYTYSNGTYTYSNFLGFYDGNELKFISEASMNIGTNAREIEDVEQTQKFVWLTKYNMLIGFDKNNTFRSYTNLNSIIKRAIISPFIYCYEKDEVILKNQTDLYVFKDQTGIWEPLITTDSILNSTSSDSTNTIYIAGVNKLHIYSNKTLKSFDVQNIKNLGRPNFIIEIKKNTFLVNYDNGFVLVDNGQVFSEYFADYSTDPIPYSLDSYSNKLLLDNGILILKFTNHPRAFFNELYFSYYKNKLSFESSIPANYNELNPFLYKSLSEESYLHYINYNQNQTVRNTLSVVKNGNDTIKITLPYEFRYPMGLVVDSNYVWIRNEVGESDPFYILRMKRDQYFVKGNLFYDSNQNGQKETTEVGVGKYPVKINPSGLLVFPDRDGNFSFAGEPGEKYTMELSDAALFNYTSKPLPYTFTESDNNQIGISLANPEPEIRTNFITPWPRCGTTGKTTLQIENTGFEPIEKVQFTLVGDPSAEINSTQAIIKKNDTLVFELTNLSPLNTQSLGYDVTFPGGEMTGQKLNFQLQTSIYANGGIVKSVTDSINTIVRCSYDPNDKAVTPAGFGEENFTLKNSPLSYLIRFENTGNDTAYTVTIYDTLDANLDQTAFEVLGSSHKVITELTPAGVLIFHFEDIMLPDNKTNSEKAQGYVRFSIRPKANLPENTVVNNKAGIVFDSNEPVITNETFNTLVTSMPTITAINFTETSGKLVYPNPARTKVYIANNQSAKVEVYDFTGKHIETSQSKEINTSIWAEGVYLFRVFDSNGNSLSSEKVQVVK